jgi:hypothetical protein
MRRDAAGASASEHLGSPVFKVLNGINWTHLLEKACRQALRGALHSAVRV